MMTVPSRQRRLSSGRWWQSCREGNDGGAEQAMTAAEWANPMEGVEEESSKLMEVEGDRGGAEVEAEQALVRAEQALVRAVEAQVEETEQVSGEGRASEMKEAELVDGDGRASDEAEQVDEG
ncbi:hypothetical protein Dimus_006276 [Dionaea muscipula]